MAAEIAALVVTRNSPATSSNGFITDTELFIANNDGNVIVQVSNDTGDDLDVTISTTATIAGMALADTVITIPAHTSCPIGPWPPVLYNDDDERVNMTQVDSGGGHGGLGFSATRF